MKKLWGFIGVFVCLGLVLNTPAVFAKDKKDMSIAEWAKNKVKGGDKEGHEAAKNAQKQARELEKKKKEEARKAEKEARKKAE